MIWGALSLAICSSPIRQRLKFVPTCISFPVSSWLPLLLLSAADNLFSFSFYFIAFSSARLTVCSLLASFWHPESQQCGTLGCCLCHCCCIFSPINLRLEIGMKSYYLTWEAWRLSHYRAWPVAGSDLCVFRRITVNFDSPTFGGQKYGDWGARLCFLAAQNLRSVKNSRHQLRAELV